MLMLRKAGARMLLVILWQKVQWVKKYQGSSGAMGHEPSKSNFAWLKFGTSNRPKKNSNSTQFML